MEQYLDQRDKMCRKLNKLKNQHERLSNKSVQNEEESSFIEQQLTQSKEKIDTVNSNIEYIQRQIEQCQTSIIQLDEVKDGFSAGLISLVEPINTLKEAHFFLKKCLNLALDKGVLAAQNQYLNSQLEFELEKIEKDYIMQQKLIQNMIDHSGPSHNGGLQDFLNPMNSQTEFENGENFEIDEIILAPRFGNNEYF